MRTTINLDDQLIQRAAELTGRSEKAVLVRLGLEALVTRETSRRLAALGGSDPGASSGARGRASR